MTCIAIMPSTGRQPLKGFDAAKDYFFLLDHENFFGLHFHTSHLEERFFFVFLIILHRIALKVDLTLTPTPSKTLFPWEVAQNFQKNFLPCFSDKKASRYTMKLFLNSEVGPLDQIISSFASLLFGMTWSYSFWKKTQIETCPLTYGLSRQTLLMFCQHAQKDKWIDWHFFLIIELQCDRSEHWLSSTLLRIEHIWNCLSLFSTMTLEHWTFAIYNQFHNAHTTNISLCILGCVGWT